MENHVRILQRGEVPVDCAPKDMVWYQHLFSFFTKNQCLDYHKNLLKDAVEDISILECFWETYSYFLAKLPLRLLSSLVRQFAETVTGNRLFTILALRPFIVIKKFLFQIIFRHLLTIYFMLSSSL